MKHGYKRKKLNRDSGHRKALLLNLVRSVVINQSIETTISKAKFVKPIVEKLITKAKHGAMERSTLVRKYVRDNLIKEKIVELSQKYSERNGGYVRILKKEICFSDSSTRVILQFV